MTATDIEALTALQNKVFRRAATIRKLTEIEQFNLDKQWTDYLQDLVDYGNNDQMLKMEIASLHPQPPPTGLMRDIQNDIQEARL